MATLLHGLIAAPFTPFNSLGQIDHSKVKALAARLAGDGLTGAFICGTTGESPSLTTAERLLLAETWREACPASLQLVVHVGHLSLGESCEFARHAQSIGADAIAAVAPCFFKPELPELVRWCREIAAAAPTLPFYYYHIPYFTGVRVPVADFLAAAGDSIPNLAGVKFTHEDLDDFVRARELAGANRVVLFGRDEILLSGLRLGATGAVGSTYNYAAGLYLKIMDDFARGDLPAAEAGQAKAQQFIDVMNQFGGLPAGKVIMKLIGLDCGPVRLPLRQLEPDDEKALAAALGEIGFFDYASRL